MIRPRSASCLRLRGIAQSLLLEAFHGRKTKLGPEHPHTIDSLRELVRLYESWDSPDEAAKWRVKLVRRGNTEE